MNSDSKKIQIAYAGLDIETLSILLASNELDVVCIAKLNEFLFITLNPVNWLFQVIYYLRIVNLFRGIEKLLLIIWELTNFLSSGPFRRYKKLIYLVSQNKINVVDFSDEGFVENYFNKNNIDVLVVSMWVLLSKKIVLAPKHGSINIHPSKLPLYRGSLPTLWALKNKDTSSAVTYIVLNEAVDSGDILYQEGFEISEQDDWLSIEKKIQKIVEKSIVGKIKDFVNGSTELLKQNTSLSSKTAKYEEYKAIDLKNEDRKDIFNKVNLYHYLDHWSVCYLNISENKNIRFKRIKLVSKQNQFNLEPGEIRVMAFSFLLGSRDGILRSVLFKDIPWNDSLALIFFIRHKIL